MAVHTASPVLATQAAPPTRRAFRDFVRPDNLPFWGVQVAAIAGVALTGWSWSGFGFAIAMYYVGMFFITAGYHRYFAHRSYKTSRFVQFLIALGGTLTSQKGVLWWAGHHRHHHKHSDQPEDLHSVRHGGLFWSHMGWIAVRDHERTPFDKIKDFARYPELRLLNSFWFVPPVALAVGLFLLGGWPALLWGYLVATTLLWHGTFTINSLSHLFGSRRYDTTDDSRNNLWLALITLGEGWHNNHHHFQGSANQGFRWYEIDVSYYVLKGLEALRIVWDVRKPPAHIVNGTRRRGKVGAAADDAAGDALALDRAA